MTTLTYEFRKDLSRIINKAQARALLLSGNVYDLFFDGKEYVPLMNFLKTNYTIEPSDKSRGLMVVTYELNDKIEIFGKGADALREHWKSFKGEDEFSLADLCVKANGNPTLAMEVMRQMAIVSRKHKTNYDLLFVIQGADLVLPEDQISRMNVADRRRVAVVHDWLTDPDFMNGFDSVVFITESRSLIHQRVAKLPQMIEIEVPYPKEEHRKHFLEKQVFIGKEQIDTLATATASLSIHALRQLIRSEDLSLTNISKKVEEHIVAQLGEGVVEFSKPSHHFSDVIGFTKIKKFMRDELIPRFKTTNKDEALPGAAIAGPIGGGKTFICEALAAELGLPVLTLKNLRSKWYGETDVIFERLKRALTAIDKVVIFVDEADTVFGGIEDGHETERRLTGKIQGMMSDPRLRGKILWLLMTARIHLLSPDIRRPGRVGDLIIPILDPDEDELKDFINWTFKGLEGWNAENIRIDLLDICEGKSAAWFAALRSQIKASKVKTVANAIQICEDLVEPDITVTRRIQTLHAILNCTRKSLISEKYLGSKAKANFSNRRNEWRSELQKLEASQR